MKIAVCISGEPRQYLMTYKNMLEYYAPYKPDIFIHSWEDTTHPGDNGEGRDQIYKQSYTKIDLKQTLKKLYSPKEILIENKNVLDNVLGQCTLPYNWLEKIKNTNLCSFSQWYSMRKCNELKHSTEKKEKFTYDIVVKTRFDIIQDPKTNNSRQLIDFLKKENLLKKDFTQKGDCILTPWLYTTYKGQNWMEYCYMYGTSNAFNIICHGEMLHELSRYPLGRSHLNGNPHHVITEYIKSKKIPIIPKTMNYGIVRPNVNEVTSDLTILKNKYNKWRKIQ